MRRFVFLLCAGCAISGCAAPVSRVTVPALPPWQAPAIARTFTAQEVITECLRLAPAAQISTSDATFIPLNHEWLIAAVVWADEFSRAIGLGYTTESHDCDKFALGVAYAANVAAARAGVRAQPLLARIHVYQVSAFASVPAGGGHALNGFLSDRGIYVLEPQPGGSQRLVPLADYPNRSGIFKILLGG